MALYDSLWPITQNRRERRAGMSIIRRRIFKDKVKRTRNLARRHFQALS